MTKTMTITCSPEELCTIISALRLEIERLWNKDPEAVELLKAALTAAQAAK